MIVAIGIFFLAIFSGAALLALVIFLLASRKKRS